LHRNHEMARQTCIWCNKEVGWDPDDNAWFHSKTGKVQCADGKHSADPLPESSRVTVWTIAFGIVLGVLLLGLIAIVLRN
jgi:hypothetical protein